MHLNFAFYAEGIPSGHFALVQSEPGAIRTHGPRLKRALLYQLSYGLELCGDNIRKICEVFNEPLFKRSVKKWNFVGKF